MFESNILQSPVMLDASTRSLAANTSIAIFDNSMQAQAYEGLDSSDMNSLDMTARRILQQQPLTPNTRKASKHPNMSTVAEEISVSVTRPRLEQPGIKPILKPFPVLDPPGSASNSPFAPKKTFASTMKGDLFDPVNDVVDETDPNKLYINLDETEGIDTHTPTMMVNKEDSDNDDPHLLLNASKAPSPTSANRSIVPDPCWFDDDYQPPSKKSVDMNVSILPDYTTMEGEDKEETIWETEVSSSKEKFNFALGNLEVVSVMKPQSTAKSSTRGDQKCLRAPHSVAIIPRLYLILVSEPSFNRIGMYSALSLEFAGWLQFPDINTKFKKPTNMLFHEDYLYVIETGKLSPFYIEGNRIIPFRPIKGCFHGLTLGDDGKIYTIYEEKGQSYLVVIQHINGGIQYVRTNKIRTQKNSDIRFLACSRGKVVISDLQNHRIIQIDQNFKPDPEKSQEDQGDGQVEYGYMGSKLGQFNRPTGVMFDDNGNLLVGDSKNNRLVVFNEKHDMVKVK